MWNNYHKIDDGRSQTTYVNTSESAIERLYTARWRFSNISAYSANWFAEKNHKMILFGESLYDYSVCRHLDLSISAILA